MIKIGLIGAGGIAGAHLRYLKSRQDVEIVALCDVKSESLERRRKEFGGKGYADFRRMLAEERLDAVWLCTPPQVRGEPLIACAERGLPAFCEKPVERDEARAAQIADRLDALKANVQIGYLFRSIPVVQRLRREMADDRVHLAQSFYGCNVSVAMSLPAWFYDKDTSGGPLVDQATHNLDLLRYLLGEVREVRGVGANPVHSKKPGYTVEEVLAFGFLFANGVVGCHTHTWAGDTWRNELCLSGERRLYRLNLNQQTLTVEEGREMRRFDSAGTDMLACEDELFLKQVASGDWSTNPSTYRDGLATLRLTVAFDRALTEGTVRL